MKIYLTYLFQVKNRKMRQIMNLNTSKASEKVQMLSRLLYSGIMINSHVRLIHDHDSFKHGNPYEFDNREICV